MFVYRSSVRGEHFKVQGRVPIAPDEDYLGTIAEVHGSSNVNEEDSSVRVTCAVPSIEFWGKL